MIDSIRHALAAALTSGGDQHLLKMIFGRRVGR